MAGPNLTYISWAQSCSRSDHTARELGGRSHMVYASRFGSRASTILFKYATQWIETSRILARETPDAVFVMTPPVFAALPAFLYAWRRKKRVVLDAHSAAFLHPRWRWLQWLQRLLCRRAATTLVHNEHIASLVSQAGGRVTLVPDVPIVFSATERPVRPAGFVIAAVCSFNYDEPIAAIWGAAERSPDVTFFVTGNARHLNAGLAANLPANIRLTGFLSDAAYGGLLTDADAVLTLTTRDHTMLRGAYEAIYQGTPVIVSDWGLLRSAFPEGAIHVSNTPEAIAQGITALRAGYAEFKAGAARLRDAKRQRWAGVRAEIEERIH